MGVVLISLGLLMHPAPKQAGPNQQPAANPKVEFVRRDFEGVVTEVTDKSINIQIPGFDAKRFPVSGPLAEGKYPGDLGSDYTYHLSDVRVGDKVGIYYSRIDGVDHCTHICILRRPGGKIPSSPGEADLLHKPSEQRQAYQDWEEKGIPVPEKYSKGRTLEFLNPPYPPIAPMPREVPPKP